MLIFIDDSGDPGFKIGKGSTNNFVISLVIFDDSLEAEKTAVAIKEVRRKLKFPDNTEFKFNKSSRKVREEFLRAVNPYKFRVRSLVVDKNKIKSGELKNNKESFYSYFIKTVLKHNDDSIYEARVKIDGSGDRIFRKSFLSYLRRELNSKQRKIIKNCKLADSKGNVLIQMADMVAGSVRRCNDKNKSDFDFYRDIIKKHIEDEWFFK